MINLDEFNEIIEQDASQKNHLDILRAGARHLGRDFTLSQAFDSGVNWPQLPIFFLKSGFDSDEVKRAISWWRNLSLEERIRFNGLI